MKKHLFIFSLILILPGTFQAQNQEANHRQVIEQFLQKSSHRTSKQKGLAITDKSVKSVLDSIVSSPYIGYNKKNSYSYDVNGQLNTENNYQFDSLSSSWQYLNIQYEFFYPGGADYTEIHYDNSMSLQSKERYIHNSNNTIAQKESFRWNSGMSTWEWDGLMEFYYSNNLQNQIIYKDYDQSLQDFVPYQKIEKTFENDKQTNAVFWVWAQDSSHWDFFLQYEFSYNSDGLIDGIRSYYEASGLLQLLDAQLLVYDENQRITKHMEIDGDDTTTHSYEYDIAGNLIRDKRTDTYNPLSFWEVVYYYDLTTPAEQAVIPYDHLATNIAYIQEYPRIVFMPNEQLNAELLAYMPVNKIDSIKIFSSSTVQPFRGRVDYFYSQRYLGIAEIATLGKIYLSPNPAGNQIGLSDINELSSFTITDLNGKLLQQGTFSSETIDISFLSPGVYFLYSKHENGEITPLKFVKI